ncbi:hypothetical protein ACWEKR_11925 [Nocardia sp. NPDC004573]
MQGIAQALENYLREAAAMPSSTAGAVEEASAAGWYAPPPGSPTGGRTPWIHLADVSVTCMGTAVVIAFRWKPDEPTTAPTYLLPMTTMEADPTTGSDALITRLDIFLDSDRWRERHTYPIGNGIAVAIMPSRAAGI